MESTKPLTQNVSIVMNGINTPTPSTASTSGNVTKATSEQLTLPGSPTLTSFVADSLVRLFPLLENEGDLTTPEELYSLTSHGFSKKNNQDCVYWKTSKDCYLMTMAELSKSSSPRLLSWGMMSNGKCVTQRISASPKTGKGSSLSDILEERPDPKYFLSSRMVERIMGYRDTSVTPLQDDTKAHKPQERTLVRVNSMHKASQADRVYSRKGKAHPTGVRQPLKFLTRNQKNIDGDYAFTVDGANTGGVRQDMMIRRLTPVECERLQGFPDNWTQYGADGELISDTQRYKMCGNAVTTNVITEIVKRLCQK